MQEIRRGKVLIDLCGECSAIWLDGGELDTLMVQRNLGIKSNAAIRGNDGTEWLGGALALEAEIQVLFSILD